VDLRQHTSSSQWPPQEAVGPGAPLRFNDLCSKHSGVGLISQCRGGWTAGAWSSVLREAFSSKNVVFDGISLFIENVFFM